MTDTIILHRTMERPDVRLWLLDDDGSLVNLASGFTFTFKLGNPGAAAVFTKTANINGAAGAGVEPSGTPNLTMTFTGAELDSLTAGSYTGQLVATTASLDRLWQFRVQVREVIT
jgi:hypothetical protein